MSDTPTETQDAETPAEQAEATPPPPVDAAAAEKKTPDATPAAAPTRPPGPKDGGYFWGTGRRKTSVARVRIRPGEGKFLINEREIDQYFFSPRDRADVVAPLKATQTVGRYDIFIKATGGGQTGQAGAVLLGLARALLRADPGLESTLREGKYLSRDPRKVERKKPGQPGARKRFQFSKR